MPDDPAVERAAAALWTYCRSALERKRGETWEQVADETKAAWAKQAGVALDAVCYATLTDEADTWRRMHGEVCDENHRLTDEVAELRAERDDLRDGLVADYHDRQRPILWQMAGQVGLMLAKMRKGDPYDRTVDYIERLCADLEPDDPDDPPFDRDYDEKLATAEAQLEEARKVVEATVAEGHGPGGYHFRRLMRDVCRICNALDSTTSPPTESRDDG